MGLPMFFTLWKNVWQSISKSLAANRADGCAEVVI